MIISRTPLRVSFVGGGTDMAWFYKRQPGAVVSTTIDKYVYVVVNKRIDQKIQFCYTNTETVDWVDDLEHGLTREALKLVGLKSGINITSIEDIASGSGLASSGAYTVGLLNALNSFLGKRTSKEKLAKDACEVEIERVKRPIGKQDQYAEVFGGLNYIQFNPDESVFVEPIRMKESTKRRLQENILLLYTGATGTSSRVLSRQKKSVESRKDKQQFMSKMAKLAREMRDTLRLNKVDSFGELLHENWMLKKSLAEGITNPAIDKWYNLGIENGAIGGKICGAGGRGFLLLYAPKTNHKKIILALKNLKPVAFSFESQGSRIIYEE